MVLGHDSKEVGLSHTPLPLSFISTIILTKSAVTKLAMIAIAGTVLKEAVRLINN